MVYRKLTNKHDAMKAIDEYVETGFHFSAPTGNGYDEWHCYPNTGSTEAARYDVSKLFDDIESHDDIPFDIRITGDDDGSFTLEIYDWDTRDHVTVWFDRERDDDEDNSNWYIKLYHVPKSEEHPLGFVQESDDIEDGDLITLYEWLIGRRNVK